MGLSVAAAVPVEIVPALAPSTAVVFGNDHDGVLGAIGVVDLLEGASDRQLPADIGLGLDERDAFALGKVMENAALIAIEIGAIEENAGALNDPRFAIPVKSAGEWALLRGLFGKLPTLRIEFLNPLGDVALVLLPRKVGAEGAAAVIGSR